VISRKPHQRAKARGLASEIVYDARGRILDMYACIASTRTQRLPEAVLQELARQSGRRLPAIERLN
jgi:hypothetical protein